MENKRQYSYNIVLENGESKLYQCDGFFSTIDSLPETRTLIKSLTLMDSFIVNREGKRMDIFDSSPTSESDVYEELSRQKDNKVKDRYRKAKNRK
jgi:hypothetical protein